MRLFVALDIPQDIRGRMASFQASLKNLAPDVRWVSPESFHVTLKFIGELPAEKVESLNRALGSVQALGFELSFREVGFFPTPKAARVFWLGVHAPSALVDLARAVDGVIAQFGVAREEDPFRPHITLARSGSGRPQRQSGDAPNQRFRRIQERLQSTPPPEFGTMSATEFFLYESRLSPRGAQYTKLERFALKQDSPNNE